MDNVWQNYTFTVDQSTVQLRLGPCTGDGTYLGGVTSSAVAAVQAALSRFLFLSGPGGPKTP